MTTNCSQLKMLAPDGKIRLRDAMLTKDIFRLIESVPSPKAEPMKLWLTNLGSERILIGQLIIIAVRDIVMNG